MNVKKRMAVAALAVAMGLSCAALPVLSAAPDEATKPIATPTLVITEICFNSTYQSNSLGVSTSADVSDYVEIVNRSEEAVSLSGITLQYSTAGYDGPFKTDRVIPVTGEEITTVLQPGETAVIMTYNDSTYKTGMHYDTEDDRRNIYRFFTDFYDCANEVSEDRFFIAAGYHSQTGKKLTNGFKLTNEDTDVVLRVTGKDGHTVCEAAYNAAEWNRNKYGLNFTYRVGADTEHPLATQPMNLGGTTPGIVRDNQLSTADMTPSVETTPIKVMEYNICATASEQKKSNGINVTYGDRWTRILSMVASETPDVIGLCEVNYLWLKKLDNGLTGADDAYDAYGRSSRGNTYGKTFVDYGGDSTWDLFNLILWRRDKYDLQSRGTFWCSSSPNSVGSYTWTGGVTGDFARAINWVILKDKATGAELFFLCAHIDAKVDAARDRSAALIIEKATELAGGRPIVMVGDWNSNENKASYDILTGEGFADACYRVADPAKMTLYGTGNQWGNNMNPKNVAAVDHCIITPDNVFVHRAYCDLGLLEGSDTLVVSDHNAMFLELSITGCLPVENEPETETDTIIETIETVETVETIETDTTAKTDSETDTATEPVTTASASGGCGANLSAASIWLTAAAAAISLKALKKKKH